MADKCKTASDVKHYLHGRVFHPQKKRIISFIQVSKTEPSKNPLKKRDNCHYLCLFVNSGKPYEPALARYIRSSDPSNPDGWFERRRLWSLTELTKVDGMQSTSSGSFELWFGTPFKFVAKNTQEKEKFIEDMADAFKKFMDKEPPPFTDVNLKSKSVVRKTANERSQLDKTKQELVERGQKLSKVDQNVADMATSAESFAGTAHKLAEHYQ